MRYALSRVIPIVVPIIPLCPLSPHVYMSAVNSVNSVNNVNSVNSVNSYSAVLPPSPMVFFSYECLIIRFCKQGTLQFCFFKPVLSIVVIILQVRHCPF